ncbi:MAG: VanZ family protein, partial [Steroidobacteraceae bacterium]
MSSPSPAAFIPPLPPAVGRVLAVLSLAAVFTLSLPDDTLWQRVIENAGHGPVFGALAIVLLLLRAPPAGLQLRSFSQYRAVFLVVVVLGIVTELLQLALPNRSVSALDVMQDAAGAALGLAVVWLVERRLARRLEEMAGDARTPVAVAIALGACVILVWQPLQAARAYAARTA